MPGLPWVGLELLGGVSFWRKPWPHGVPVRRAIAFFVTFRIRSYWLRS